MFKKFLSLIVFLPVSENRALRSVQFAIPKVLEKYQAIRVFYIEECGHVEIFHRILTHEGRAT